MQLTRLFIKLVIVLLLGIAIAAIPSSHNVLAEGDGDCAALCVQTDQGDTGCLLGAGNAEEYCIPMNGFCLIADCSDYQ